MIGSDLLAGWAIEVGLLLAAIFGGGFAAGWWARGRRGG